MDNKLYEDPKNSNSNDDSDNGRTTYNYDNDYTIYSSINIEGVDIGYNTDNTENNSIERNNVYTNINYNRGDNTED